MDTGAGSCTLSDSANGSGSGTKLSSGKCSGSCFVVSSSYQSAVDSGLRSVVGMAKSWLGSGSMVVRADRNRGKHGKEINQNMTMKLIKQ